MINQARTAIDGDGGSRNTSDESLKRSRKVVHPHTSPVCARIANIRGGARQRTQDGAFGAGHQPTQTDTRGRPRASAKPAGSDKEDTAVVDGG